jgi:ferredoxin
MRITVDTDRCIGAGQCVLTEPDLFDQGDDGLAVPLDPEPGPAGAAGAAEAAALCPAQAILLED